MEQLRNLQPFVMPAATGFGAGWLGNRFMRVFRWEESAQGPHEPFSSWGRRIIIPAQPFDATVGGLVGAALVVALKQYTTYGTLLPSVAAGFAAGAVTDYFFY